MSGLCECDCGQATAISPGNHRTRGYVKGQPRRFVHGHQSRHPGWQARLAAAVEREERRRSGDPDDRFIAYYTGVADARNHRPRRVDIADTSTIGERYTAGYDSLARVVCPLCVQWRCVTCKSQDWPQCCDWLSDAEPFWPDGTVAVLTQDEWCNRCAQSVADMQAEHTAASA